MYCTSCGKPLTKGKSLSGYSKLTGEPLYDLFYFCPSQTCPARVFNRKDLVELRVTQAKADEWLPVEPETKQPGLLERLTNWLF